MKLTITIELNGETPLPDDYSTMADLLKDQGIYCLYLSDDGEWERDYRFWVDKVVTHRK